MPRRGVAIGNLAPVPTSPVLVVQLDSSDQVGRLGDWLTSAGLALDICDTSQAHPLPGDLHAHAGLVVLGGSMGAWDDHVAPVLADVRALLRAAVLAEVPTLGICLGHQLLAVANGGRCEPNPDGPELGAQLIAKRSAAWTDPLFGPLPITPDVLQWHYDAVTTLPAGAIQLASSPICDQQAFRLGRLAWGVQFHIETTPEMVRLWGEEHRAMQPDADDANIDALIDRAVAIHDDLAEVWAPFAAAFAAIVLDPSSVAPSRAVPTSSAAPVTDPAAIRAALAAEAVAARTMLPMPEIRPPWHE